MSLYALHANALRPLVAKYKGRQFRSDDDMREFVDDLLNALLSKGPIEMPEPLRLKYEGSGPALVIDGGGAWSECAVRIIPQVEDCLCDFGCCCDDEFASLLDGLEGSGSGSGSTEVPSGPLVLTVTDAGSLNGTYTLHQSEIDSDRWYTDDIEGQQFRLIRHSPSNFDLGLFPTGSTSVTAQASEMRPIFFFLRGGVDGVFSAEIIDQ